MRAGFNALLAAAACRELATPVLADTGDPLPRFEDAVCPGVTGLQVETAELLVGRIRQNAQALGRQLAPPETCSPNLIVSFVNDGRAAIEGLHRDKSYLFADMNGVERAELLHDTGPVHVFSQVFARNRDGIGISRRDSLTTPPHTTMWMAHSMIYRPIQENIVYVLELFDAAAVRGLSVDQIADYATVRAFVHKPPRPAETGGNSILNLFDSPAGARPAGLTSFDHALLGSLYEGIPNINRNARIATIAKATGHGAGAE